MKLSKFGVIVLIFIVLFSIFIAKVSNIIAVNSSWKYDDKNKKSSVNSDSVIIKDSLDHLIWFVQVIIFIQLLCKLLCSDSCVIVWIRLKIRVECKCLRKD